MLGPALTSNAIMADSAWPSSADTRAAWKGMMMSMSVMVTTSRKFHTDAKYCISPIAKICDSSIHANHAVWMNKYALSSISTLGVVPLFQ